jgi:hypothetical protein
MRNIPTAAAAALCALLVSAQASAQMRGAAPAPATPAPGPTDTQSQPSAPTAPQAQPTAPASAAGAADTGAAANTNATAAPAQPLATGLTVKDNTGAAIGQITAVKTDAAGRSMATIKMGADTFQAPAANLAVQDGAAVINLTQAQIASQLHPKPKS